MIVGVSNSIDTNLILIDICIVLTCLRIFLLANVAAISSLLISFWPIWMRPHWISYILDVQVFFPQWCFPKVWSWQNLRNCHCSVGHGEQLVRQTWRRKIGSYQLFWCLLQQCMCFWFFRRASRFRIMGFGSFGRRREWPRQSGLCCCCCCLILIYLKSVKYTIAQIYLQFNI